jgi:hypothetical protein
MFYGSALDDNNFSKGHVPTLPKGWGLSAGRANIIFSSVSSRLLLGPTQPIQYWFGGGGGGAFLGVKLTTS